MKSIYFTGLEVVGVGEHEGLRHIVFQSFSIYLFWPSAGMRDGVPLRGWMLVRRIR